MNVNESSCPSFTIKVTKNAKEIKDAVLVKSLSCDVFKVIAHLSIFRETISFKFFKATTGYKLFIVMGTSYLMVWCLFVNFQYILYIFTP